MPDDFLIQHVLFEKQHMTIRLPLLLAAEYSRLPEARMRICLPPPLPWLLRDNLHERLRAAVACASGHEWLHHRLNLVGLETDFGLTLCVPSLWSSPQQDVRGAKE